MMPRKKTSKKKKAGYRLDGVRIYHVSGKKASSRATYSSKAAAKRALKKRGKRKH